MRYKFLNFSLLPFYFIQCVISVVEIAVSVTTCILIIDHRSSLLRRLLSCSYTEKVQRDEPGNPRLNLKLSEYAPLSPIKFLKQTDQPSTYAKLNVNPTTHSGFVDLYHLSPRLRKSNSTLSF